MKKNTAKRLVTGIVASLFFTSPQIQSQSLGIWTSQAELSVIPMSGASWQAVLNAANQNMSNPQVSDQDDNTNCYVLAAAIVSERYRAAGNVPTADLYKNKVEQAIDLIAAGGDPGGRTLAAGREVGAYVMAADLVGYRPQAFLNWVTSMINTYVLDGNTMLSTFHDRPNNWGTMNFGSLAAMYWYLNDNANMTSLRNYFVAAITPSAADPGHSYGELSWQAQNVPKIINGCNTSKQGMDLDGLLPEEMRRGGTFNIPPAHTGYAWEGMQGIVVGARIFERYGASIWNEANMAIYRAAYALQVRLENDYGGWAASGEDLWQLMFIDHAYGSNFACGQASDIWEHGKNAGWAYVLGGDAAVHCAPYTLDPCSSTTGIHPAGPSEQAYSIGVHPNPATTTITVELFGIEKGTTEGKLSIFNALGEEIRTQKITFSGSKATEISVDALDKGMYFIRFRSVDNTILSNGTLIKQ